MATRLVRHIAICRASTPTGPGFGTSRLCAITYFSTFILFQAGFVGASTPDTRPLLLANSSLTGIAKFNAQSMGCVLRPLLFARIIRIQVSMKMNDLT